MKPYHYFWQLIRFRPKYYFTDVVTFTLHAAATVIPGLILRAFFNFLTEAEGFSLDVTGVIVGQIGFFLLSAITLSLAAVYFVNFQYQAKALLIRNMFARILQMPASQPLPKKKDGSRMSSGEVMSTLRDDPDLMLEAIVLVDDVIGFAVTGLLAGIIMLSINPTITLGTFVPLAIVIAIAQRLGETARRYRAISRETTSDVTGMIADMFNATQAIKVGNAESRMINRFRSVNDRRRQAMVRDKVLSQLVDALSNGTIDAGLGLVLLLAARVMYAGTFTIGDFALFAAYIWPMTQFMRIAGNVITRYRQVSVSTERLEVMMQGLPAGAVTAHHPIYVHKPLPPIPQPSKANIHNFNNLTVRNLSFIHPDSGKGIRNISFQVKRGEFVVVTGRIGSGKTTLLKTLLGLLPHQAGEILWNGEMVDDPAGFLIPPRTAYTSQIPRLFSTSLRDNLLMGLTASDTEIKKALHTAVMLPDLTTMENGLETMVGPRGVRLSGGQVQRSAAARMFLRKAELLIFDDLSSALDVHSEKTLWQRLLEVGSDQWVVDSKKPATTCLVVSHRRPALRRADRIIVLKDGQIIDTGTLDELLDRCPEMQHLWHGSETETNPDTK